MESNINWVLMFEDKNIPVVCKRMIYCLIVNPISQRLPESRVEFSHRVSSAKVRETKQFPVVRAPVVH